MHPGPPCQVPEDFTPQLIYRAEGDDNELSTSTVTSHIRSCARLSQKFHQHQTSHSCIKWPSVSIHLDSSNAAYSEGSSLASNRGIWWQESSSRETREIDQDVRCVFGDPIPSGQPRCITVN